MEQGKSQAIIFQRPPLRGYDLYLWIISVTGLALTLYALFQLSTVVSIHNFLILAVLMVIAQFTTASLPVSGKAGVTYSVSSAITLAAVVLFGVYAAILIDAIGAVTVWVIKPQQETVWKKKLSQLGFNMGVTVLASFLAGTFFSTFVGTAWYSFIAVWIATALIYDQVNLWGVLTILRLQHGEKFSFRTAWRGNRWAILINVSISTIAGGVLILATTRLDWIGIIIFFLPILLSSYSFYIYVSQTKQQMLNMESIISERTRTVTQLSREKDAFLALLTHDMKSPLTSIGMYAEMMRRKPDLLLQKPHAVENILRAHATLTDLVNNIVDLERLQTDGALQIDRSLFDVTDLAEYVVALLLPQAEQKQIKLTTQFTRQQIRLHADRLQIERVLTNLVSNAIKYSDEAGVVTVAVQQTDENVSVIVEDNGYGIPAEELPYIFDRYRRVDKHRKVAVGTGLGLAIAKAIAEGHGGTLVAESAENIGSTFTLTLPLST